jgi:photosystem II stability/assembly factor-like uncharacterized protein
MKRLALLAVSAVLAAPGSALAAGWTSTVLPGAGTDDSVAAAGNGVLYADGFTSVDGGSSWRPAPGGAWESVAVDPADPAHAYVYRPGGTLAQTHDAGLSFSDLDTSACGPPAPGVGRVVLDPMRPASVYLERQRSGGAALCRSDDGGASFAPAGSWSTAPVLLPGTAGRSRLVALYSDGAHVVVERSDDGGATWSAELANLAEYPARVLAGACWPAHCWLVADHLTAGRVILLGDAGTFVSAGGTHWEPQPAQLEAFPGRGSLGAIPVAGHPGVLAAGDGGVWLSLDGGISWRERLPVPGPLVEDAAGTLYVITAGGAVRSSDAGATWTWLGRQVIDRAMLPEVHADARGVLYAVTRTQALRYDAAAAAWAPSSFLPTATLQSAALGHGVLLARRDVELQPGDVLLQFGLSRSVDGGRTWHVGAGPHCPGRPRERAMLAFDNFVTGAGDRTVFLQACGGRLFRSEDAGATWHTRGVVPDEETPAVAQAGHPVLFNGSSRSTDGGLTFHRLPALARARSVAVAATTGALYARAKGKVVAFSADGRTRRGEVAAPNPFIDPIVLVDARHPRRAFVVLTLDDANVRQQAVYETRDGGATWQSLAIDGALPGCRVNSAALGASQLALVLVSDQSADSCPGVVLVRDLSDQNQAR